MGLETVNYLDDYNESYPVSGDPKSEGDDHLRNIKKGAKQTFPGLVGRAWRVQAKSGAYTAVVNDNMTTLKCTAALTLSLTAAATLGSGWMTMVKADGGAVTVDPNSTETIDGAATIIIPQGCNALVVCDGTGFISLQSAAAFEAGTALVFPQASAPSGWTKSTTHNDKALRIVSGAGGGYGGVSAFSSVFGTGKVTGGHSITQAELPNCSFIVNDTGHVHPNVAGYGGGTYALVSGSSPYTTNGSTGSATTGITVDSGGSGTAHDHPLSLDLEYVDTIIATKD